MQLLHCPRWQGISFFAIFLEAAPGLLEAAPGFLEASPGKTEGRPRVIAVIILLMTQLCELAQRLALL